MGPFLAASSGETTEWCDSGIEGWWWRKGVSKGQGSKREWIGGRRKERVKEEGADGRF